MVWMPFIGRKQASLQSSSPSAIIPNFCLGSQPRRIPLIFAWVALRFSTHQGTLYRLSSLFYFLFSFFSLMLSLLFCFSLPLHFTLSSLFFFFFRYGYKRGFGCFNLPSYPLAHTSLGILGNINFIKMT